MSRRLGWAATLAGCVLGVVGMAVFHLSMEGRLFSSPFTLMAAEGGLVAVGVGICIYLRFLERRRRG